MTIKDFIALLRQTLGKDIVLCQDTQATPQAIVVPAQRIAEISQALHAHEKTYFDSLSCLTAIDNGPETGTLEVVYNLYSIPYGHALMLKATLPRNLPNEPLPTLPSVSHVWKAALWQEREAYDLLGICFTDHPDLRRILLPGDWQGHPLRKDYQHPATYHGIEVD